MKTALLSVQELGQKVITQAATRKDFIAPTKDLIARPSRTLEIVGKVNDVFGINDIAHEQIALHTSVPQDYYRRIRDTQPGLWAQTVNTLLHANPAEQRMVRTLDGTARAFLSNKYRPIDNVDLLNNLLPTLNDFPGLRFASADVTERRMYLKVVSSRMEGEVKRGDVVQMGLLISNSEVGLGSIVVAPFTERLVCTNGATHLDYGQRRAHLGRALSSEDDNAAQFFSDETRKADDNAFFLKVRDTVKACLDGNVLAKLLEDMRNATQDKIEDPQGTVDAVAVQVGLTETEKTSVLTHLINGADLSRWGLANAITRAAQDAEGYDRATELEAAGGALMVAHGQLPGKTAIEQVKVRRRRASRN